MPPRSQNSGYGLILGYRSGLDSGREKNFFLTNFDHQNRENLHALISVSAYDRNRAGVVDLVGREPLMLAKVENGVTKSCIVLNVSPEK